MTEAGFTILEVIWWLLVAATTGFALGWVLRKWLSTDKLKEDYERSEAVGKREREALRRQLQDAKADAARFSAELETRTPELDQRRADFERAHAQLAERHQAVTKLEAELKTYRSKTMKLEGQILDRESTIASLRSTATPAEALGRLQKDLDGAYETVGSLRKEAEGYQETITSLQLDLEKATKDNDELADRIAASEDELKTVAISLTESRTTEESLRSRIDDLEAATTGGEQTLPDLEARLVATMRELDRVTTRLREMEERHPEDAASTEAADEADETTVTVSVVDGLSPGDTVAEIAIRTRGDGPVVEDDLKQIRGIGPKLDQLLKEMDITSFRQIANFTVEDIQYVTAALDAFPGRIERDDWMSSAATEHAKKYDEPV